MLTSAKIISRETRQSIAETLKLDKVFDGCPYIFKGRDGHEVVLWAKTRDEAEQVHLAAERAKLEEHRKC